MEKKSLVLLACILGGLLSRSPLKAQASGSTSQTMQTSSNDVVVPSDQEIDLLRKDLRAKRKQIIAANMKLTEKEAEKFWPVYDQYVAELIKINDTKYTLIQDYARNYSQMTTEQAEKYVRGMVEVDVTTSQLRLKYWPNFLQVISAKRTALFFQLDRRISTMIDMQLSAQLPLIEP